MSHFSAVMAIRPGRGAVLSPACGVGKQAMSLAVSSMAISKAPSCEIRAVVMQV